MKVGLVEKSMALAFSETEELRFLAIIKGRRLFIPVCRLIDRYARLDSLEGVKWLHENGFRASLNTVTFASGGGSLRTIKWLMAKGLQWSSGAFTIAKREGHLDIVEFLLNNSGSWSRYREVDPSERLALFNKEIRDHQF